MLTLSYKLDRGFKLRKGREPPEKSAEKTRDAEGEGISYAGSVPISHPFELSQTIPGGGS